jgi:hypothetical protein
MSIDTISFSWIGRSFSSLIYARRLVGNVIPCTVTLSKTYCAAANPPQLRVHGTVGLRVADASVMPQIITGPGTNASTHMIAGRAAKLILA